MPGIDNYSLDNFGFDGLASNSELVVQSQTIPPLSSVFFNFDSQPNIAFVTTSASNEPSHSMMLLGPYPGTDNTGTLLFTLRLNSDAYNSVLSYSNWVNGSGYRIYNNQSAAHTITVRAFFIR